MDNNRGGLRPRIYFSPGDIVEVKQDIANKPRMVVESVDKTTNPIGGERGLLGVTCFWFDADTKLQVHRFSTKDLKKLPKDNA